MENKRKDNSDEINDFNKKYNHYSDEYDNDISDDSTNDDNQTFEDLSSYSSEANEEFYLYNDADGNSVGDDMDEIDKVVSNKMKSKDNFFVRNKYRNTKIIALCLVIAILLTGGGVLGYFYYISRGMNSGDNGIDFGGSSDDNYLDDTIVDFNVMGDVNANSLNDFLYKWANNGGEKMYNKNVINVLLCGVDSTSGSAESGRSDSMILISVNKKTEKITMVSLLRDSWTYIKVPNADGTSYDYYFKLNAAYSKGGPATLLETIENDFKIEIDQYIAVDFNSFPKLIDAVGGVTVDVQEYEAKYIRRTSSQTDFPSGVSLLSGKQALIYSRIRHSDSDSDVSRTRRQRTVIKALIESAKTATKGQLVNAFKQVSGYVRTGYTQSEVLSLIATAYSHDWMSFEMSELMLPDEDYVDRLSTYVDSQSAWVVDYALCAQKLQQALYGETNIVLSADRTSALDLVTNKRNTTADSGSSGYSGSSGGSDYSYSTSTRTTYSYNYDDNDNNDDDNNNDYSNSNTSSHTQPDTTHSTSSQTEENTDSETND